ncbi:site-specific integrase [Variovorax saccharolyticus]|uniref:site-specific integrase n=1 Tax=Variovorax saccharolyticus TaxID=3053516 RepID=UPI0025774F65|nr:site-specific integrase [Variovorax sp. J31P216]MDM0024628.1 site-specific integrase [Variovorax sp. J31P216]
MPQYLARKGNTYYFRQAVPAELRHIIGKREVKKTLGKDFDAAKRACKQKAVEVDCLIADARAALDSMDLPFDSRANIQRTKRMGLATLTTDLERKFSSHLRESLLDTDRRRRMDGFTADAFADYEREVRDLLQVLRRQLAMGKVEPMIESTAAHLHALGYDAEFSEAEWRRLAFVATEATLQAYEGVLARQSGAVVTTGGQEVLANQFVVQAVGRPMVAPGVPTIEWRHLYDVWAAEVVRPQRTKNSYLAAMNLFRELRPQVTPMTATREDALAFRDHLLGAGLHASTVANKIGFLGTIMNAGRNSTRYAKHLGSNPFENIKIKKEIRGIKNSKRLPFSDADLLCIFSSDIYAKGDRPKGGGGEAAAWIPAIAYLSGANLEEIAVLRAEQFHVDAQGNPYFQIGDSKNSNRANRQVPIHPALVDAGFLDYVRSRNGRLFPKVTSQREEQSASFSKWFGRHLDSLRITEKSKVFHSFRHLFKDLCRNAGLDDSAIDQICGHEPGTVGGKYGDGRRIDVLAGLLAQVVPPVPLPRIHRVG